MDELKQCPFCGGEAETYHSDNPDSNIQYWGVDCKSDECITHTMIADYATEKDAVAAWNRRKEGQST